MASQDEKYKLNSKLLEDILTEIAPDILGGILVPKEGQNLLNLLDMPQIEVSKARNEDIMKLAQFVASNLAYTIKTDVSVPKKEGFVTRTIGDLINAPNVDLETYKNAFMGIIRNPFDYFDFKFEPKTLSEEKKKELMKLLKPIYGVDLLEDAANRPLRFKEEVMNNPGKYFSVRADNIATEIYGKHKERLDIILSDYAANFNKGPEQKDGEGIDGLVPGRIEGMNPPPNFGKAGRFSRFWHTNPLSMFGELYRRARVNARRLAKGKIGPWKETFEVEGKRYNLHNPAELGSLPDKEKIYLGKEYKKRKLHDWLVIAAIVAGFVPEVTGFGLWIHDKYFRKVENPPRPWEYIWPDRPQPKTIEGEARPSQPAPVWTESGCRERYPCPQPEYSEQGCTDNCKSYFECKPETIIRTKIVEKKVYVEKPCPPQRPCSCEGRVREYKR